MNVFIVALSFLISSNSFASDRGPDRSVTVNGSCTRSVIPDRASILATAEAKDLDPKKAMAEATRTYEKMRERVMKLKIADRELTTAEVSLNELKEWDSKRLVSRGFVARMGLRVESSDPASLGEVGKAATESGVREIGALATFLSAAKQRSETDACLREAVKSAQKKAQEMVDAAGAKLGDVISLTESSAFTGGSPIRPMNFGALAKRNESAEMSDAPTIDAGKQELTTQVTATFGIR